MHAFRQRLSLWPQGAPDARCQRGRRRPRTAVPPRPPQRPAACRGSQHGAAEVEHQRARKFRSKTQGQRGLVILQIGDSHTAADYFTAELRQKLQARYGNGGVGYLDAGKPHIGVRSGAMKVTASPGWTYHAIQRSENIAEFWLSGFNAVATASGEALTFASDTPVPFDSIEIEALRQPGGGSIDISLDGAVKSSADLNGTAVEPVVLRLRPDGAPSDRVRQIEIRSRGAGVVSIASIGILPEAIRRLVQQYWLSGATIDLVKQVRRETDDRRLAPPRSANRRAGVRHQRGVETQSRRGALRAQLREGDRADQGGAGRTCRSC